MQYELGVNPAAVASQQVTEWCARLKPWMLEHAAEVAMTTEMKQAALSGQRSLQWRWLYCEIQELLAEQPMSEAWILELLDVAGLCAKWSLTLPPIVRDMLSMYPGWLRDTRELYHKWLKGKLEKGYSPMSFWQVVQPLLCDARQLERV